MLRKWDKLPDFMKCDEVKEYYNILSKKRISLIFKRIFDLVVSLILFFLLFIPMIVIAIIIKLDSKGPVFYRQRRVTTYGQEFHIFKFRTMVVDADKLGSSITVMADNRVTRVGCFLRKYRMDELPQLIDIIRGKMSFVGTRPEIPAYVHQYSNEMNATLLVPAGITSEASIRYKDEAILLDAASDVDKVYIEIVLPGKMKYNLDSLKNYSFMKEIQTMFRTILAVMGKEYK